MRKFLHKEKVKRLRNEKPLRLRRTYRSYSDHTRLLVVYLRYGSTTDFTRLKRGWADISKLTGIIKMTCKAMVDAFHRRGNSPKRLFSTGRPVHPLPPDVLEYVRTSLYDDRFLSLAKRCALIQQKFGFYMPESRLKRTFKRFEIKY